MFIEEDLDVPSWIGFVSGGSEPTPPQETFWLMTSNSEYVFDFSVSQVEVFH